jgi:hypothetical protein
MSSDRSNRKSMLERDQNRAALRDAIPGVVGLVVLEGIVAALDLDAGSNGWHLAISLLPLLPGVWLAWAQVRSLRRSDEYQRNVQLEAMSVGFAAAMLVAMTGGLLDSADVGSNAQYLQLTFIAGILSWVGALAVRSRR